MIRNLLISSKNDHKCQHFLIHNHKYFLFLLYFSLSAKITYFSKHVGKRTELEPGFGIQISIKENVGRDCSSHLIFILFTLSTSGAFILTATIFHWFSAPTQWAIDWIKNQYSLNKIQYSGCTLAFARDMHIGYVTFEEPTIS